MPSEPALQSVATLMSSDRGWLRQMFEQAPGFMALLENTDHRIAMANPAFFKLIGNRELVGSAVAEALPEFVEQGFVDMLDRVAESGEPLVGRALPIKVERERGSFEELFVDFVFQPLLDPEGRTAAIFVQGHDVTEHKQSEAVRIAHNHVLEMAIGDHPLEETLNELLRLVESTSRTGVLGSILLLDEDGVHLRHGAAPSLPPPYMAAIDGSPIGPVAGSCGTAAYTAMPVFVSDIARDPLWAEYKELALLNGLKACWSIPIMSSGRKVLGTFAMYHREPREPTVRDLVVVDVVTQTAALVIDRKRAEIALREREQRLAAIEVELR